jgi:RNA-directed DNA polymerase
MNEAIASGAPINLAMHWHDINWAKCTRMVRRHQARIVKATQDKRWGKVKSLQHLLTHSFAAKALAVKRVTENRGKNTPGVDGLTWSTPDEKMSAIEQLKSNGYNPLPLRRVTIPKSNGKERPLGIPTMNDRAMQALHLLSLEPVSETLADSNSYGFRPARSTADAMEQCFKVLSKKGSARWVLEGDIAACFDNIDHNWLIQNIPVNKQVLRKWLKAGYVDKGNLFPTEKGTPQGGIISPTLANMALDGLQKVVEGVIPRSTRRGQNVAKVNFVRYADDFIITGGSKEILENEIKPAVIDFFASRGLSLSEEKTRISHITDGYDFLGQNVRRYGEKLFIKPSLKSIKSIKTKIRLIMNGNKQATTENLIRLLNPVIRGWANYHKHVVSSVTFHSLDKFIWEQLWQWSKRRHPKKSSSWVKKKYFHSHDARNWVFSAETLEVDQSGARKWKRLISASYIHIQRHVKIKAGANPFDPKWEEYFDDRLNKLMKNSLKGRKKLSLIWKNQKGACPVCNLPITQETDWDIHHKIRRVDGGDNRASNLIMHHINCHRKTHSQDNRLSNRLHSKLIEA